MQTGDLSIAERQFLPQSRDQFFTITLDDVVAQNRRSRWYPASGPDSGGGAPESEA